MNIFRYLLHPVDLKHSFSKSISKKGKKNTLRSTCACCCCCCHLKTMNLLKSEPTDKHQRKQISIFNELLSSIDSIFKFQKHCDSLLFDAILKQSIFDFVQATVLQEQIIPNINNARIKMMKHHECKNLFWITDLFMKTWGKNHEEPHTINISRLKRLHYQMMTNVKIDESDKGKFCTRARYTTYKGKRHEYPKFSREKDVEDILQPVLEKYNRCLHEIFHEKDIKISLEKSIYLASWIFYQITTIHPFIDGNGRTARILASRCFPQLFYVPVFIWSKISMFEIEYIDALIKTRETQNLSDLDSIILKSVQIVINNIEYRINKCREKVKAK